MKNIIVKLQNIDFLKTYKYSKKYGKKFREFTVYRYSKIKTKPTSKIEISKKLSFGCVPGNTLLNKWRNSTLLMGNNSHNSHHANLNHLCNTIHIYLQFALMFGIYMD